jgi:c-di-GMP-binding flagellar brake protein YcgR
LRFAIILLIVIIFLVFVLWRLRGGKNRFPWYEFYSRGRKEGFSFKEIGFLRRMTLQNKLEKPQSIFWSTKQLDKCLKPALINISSDVNMTADYKNTMTSKLLDLRTKAEFNLPKYKKRIRDTTAVPQQQKIVLRDTDYGTFVSWVVEVTRKNLVVTMPRGKNELSSLNWKSRRLSVFFWRIDDAGYLFETKVLDQITSEEYPLLYLAHSNNLQRMQKRKDIRLQTRLRARFKPIVYSLVEGDNRAIISQRVHTGNIIDLSASGCCMLAGNMLKKSDRIKIEFKLTPSKKIVALGVILNASKTTDDKVNKYNIMFVKIGPTSRNNILLYVFNIFGDRDEEEQKVPLKKATPPPVEEQPAT